MEYENLIDGLIYSWGDDWIVVRVSGEQWDGMEMQAWELGCWGQSPTQINMTSIVKLQKDCSTEINQVDMKSSLG